MQPGPCRVLAWLLDRWAVIAGLAWLGSALLYLMLPPSPDQFNHAYLGWRLLQGDVPYRDFIDMNWPGVMGLQAVAAWVFGVRLWAWHAADFLLFAISAIFLADIVRLAAGRDAGRLTLILAPLMYVGNGYWIAGQHDMSAAQFLVGAFWFHARGYARGAVWWQVGTGLFLGVAAMNKPTVGVLAPMLLLQVLWLRLPPQQVVMQSVTAGAALLVTLGAAFSAVLMRGTTSAEAVDALYTYNTVAQFFNSASIVKLLTRPFSSLVWTGATLVALLALPWLFRRGNRSIASTAIPLLWLTGVLSYLAQSRGNLYHLAPCYLALAGGVSITLALLRSGRIGLRDRSWNRSLVFGVFVAVSAGVAYRLSESYYSLPLSMLRGNFDLHLSRFKAGDDISAAEAAAFVARLRAEPETDCVLVVGNGSAISYLSQRRLPTRFYYFQVVVNARPPLPMADRWVELWERDLAAADCRVVLVADWVRRDWIDEPTRAAAALRAFLSQYRETGSLGPTGGLVIYERK